MANFPHCKKICKECPFIIGNVGKFPPERFVALAHTAYDMATEVFACHMSKEGKEKACAGFMMVCQHNMTIRLRAIQGHVNLNEIDAKGHELHDSYFDMAIDNGCDLFDPALRQCK